MIHGQSVLAVIPARGGSKRVPRKNLKSYCGKSLLAWAVETALPSKYIDQLCVSSDDPAILEAAAWLKAKPLPRPDWLATDKAQPEGVLIHTLYTFKWADWVVLLQPTSPLRTTADIDGCIERAQGGSGCITFNEHGSRNGAVYVARSTDLIARVEFHRDILDQFLIMPNDRSLDIDYAADFDR